jgi:hypothetical protein
MTNFAIIFLAVLLCILWAALWLQVVTKVMNVLPLLTGGESPWHPLALVLVLLGGPVVWVFYVMYVLNRKKE